MKNRVIKFIKLVLIVILNNIIIGMILGFLWYGLGLANTTINMLSGADTLQIAFEKFEYMYYFILYIMQFIMIVLLRKIFNSRKTYITYYILAIILSSFLYLQNSLGFNTGLGINDFGNEIQTQYIFIACMGLQYTSLISILNISSLLGLIYISRKKERQSEIEK